MAELIIILGSLLYPPQENEGRNHNMGDTIHAGESTVESRRRLPGITLAHASILLVYQTVPDFCLLMYHSERQNKFVGGFLRHQMESWRVRRSSRSKFHLQQ